MHTHTEINHAAIQTQGRADIRPVTQNNRNRKSITCLLFLVWDSLGTLHRQQLSVKSPSLQHIETSHYTLLSNTQNSLLKTAYEFF